VIANRGDHYAPDLIVGRGYFDGAELGILRTEQDLAVPMAEALHGELPVDNRDYDAAITRGFSSVNNEDVPGKDSVLPVF